MLIVFLISFQNSYTQNFVFSEPQKSRRANYQIEMVRGNNQKLLILQEHNKMFRKFLSIERYSEQLHLESKVQIPFESEILSECFEHQNKVYILSTVFDRITRRSATRVRLLNKDLKLQKKMLVDTLLHTISMDQQMQSIKLKNKDIICSFSIDNERNGATAYMKIKIFDLSFEKIKEVKISLPIEKTNTSIDKILESKNGLLYFILSNTGRKSQSVYCLVFDWEKEIFTTLQIDRLIKKTPSTIHTLLEENPRKNEVFLASSFAKSKGEKNQNMLLLQFKDSLGAEPTTKTFLFNEDLDNPIRRKAKNRFKDLVPKHLLFFSDSSLCLLSEETIVESLTSIDYVNNTPVIRNQEVYFFGNVVAFFLNRQLEVVGRDTLLKNQTTTNDQGIFSSFALVKKGDEFRLLLNGLKRNQGVIGCDFSRKGFGTFSEFSGPILSQAIFSPQQLKQFSDGTFLVQFFL
ncbi:MAG: hypothetical protein VXX63_02795, partial [Bacteroidota bacterium]|nr:hypothetical protein [Bacteroidota bacterium]